MDMTKTLSFTRSDYMALPEGFPAELIEGALVKEPAPSFGHQWYVGQIYRLLVDLVGSERVILSPIDVFIDDYNILQPDVCVVEADLRRDVAEIGIPTLAIEVLSPSTARRDREQKRRIYLRAGIQEVWILDTKAQRIELYTPEGGQTFTGGEEATSTTVPGFRLTPEELFSED